MTIRNLEFAAAPKSVAVFGASPREGAVGRTVLRNIIDGGFEGTVWPVNPKYDEIDGMPCYPDAKALPGAPDLGVIVTPAKTVPGIVAALGEKGGKAAVVISAGLTRENGLRQAMLDAAWPHLFRIIGPNTVGLIVPGAKLNASFSHIGAKPGGLALLSQSGAIATSLMDWAAAQDIGFSHIVSLGDMADVDVGDYLDMLAGDGRTRAILLYLETIPEPRKFMSAARAAARLKPVIAIKSGRHARAAQAAATHTGALAGGDRVAEAALHRAGILRVSGIAELFDAAEVVARFPPIEKTRVGIVTNGGGAGVLAIDRLLDFGGHIAELSEETMAKLDADLPANWSHANPVDIIGDAPPSRFINAVEAVAADPGTDALIILNCPTGLAASSDSAAAVASLARKGRINNKPALACWLGEATAREARTTLQQAGIADFATPGDAATALSYLGQWSSAQKALTRVPSSRSEDVRGDHDAVDAIFRTVAEEERTILSEPEAKAALSAYGITVPGQEIVSSSAEVKDAAARLLEKSSRLVVKLLSRTLTHKSDVGGVILDLESPDEALEAAHRIEARLKQIGKSDDLHGFVIQQMVERDHAEELIVGVSRDPVFGPVVVFGAGGTAVEVMDDIAMALPPLDNVLAQDLMESTRIGRLLEGYRDRKPADAAAIAHTLNAVSQMLVEFPCIKAMDINPLLADEHGVIALDARIEIDPDRVGEPGPNPDLAIRPYPGGLERDVDLEGHHYETRPIKPSDIALYEEFFARMSPEDIRLRFFAPRKHFSDQMLARLTQLDYERDMAFVALRKEDGALAGIGRYFCDPDHEMGEFAVIVRTDLQGHGLGHTLLQRLIEFGRADGLKCIEGLVLKENTKMLKMCRELGFRIRSHPDEQAFYIATLDLN